MTILPWLAVGLLVSVVIMLIFRAWEGWKLWKDRRSRAAQSGENSDDGVHDSGEQPPALENERKQ